MCLCAGPAPAQTKPLYRLPSGIPSNAKPIAETEPLIIGCDDGLYKLLSSGTRQPLWAGGSVSQILRTASFWSATGMAARMWWCSTTAPAAFPAVSASVSTITAS